MICELNHRYDSAFESLPEAQDNRNGGRHICAGCAYDEGFSDGQAGASPKTNLSHLPQSQAAKVRHRDAMAAYNLGYEKGKEARK